MSVSGLRVEAWPFSGQRLLFLGHEGMPPEEAVAAVLSQLDGGSMVLVSEIAVRDRLLERGARQARHLVAMRRDLSPVDGPDPAGVVLRGWQQGDAELLAPALLEAYHLEHPDAASRDLDEATEHLTREVSDPDNPLMAATTVAVHKGLPVGAAVVQRSEHVTGWEGPWVMDVFRSPSPALPGIGTAMLRHVIDVLRSDGEAYLGLAVTATNPARKVYERLGFTYGMEGWVLVLPDAPAP